MTTADHVTAFVALRAVSLGAVVTVVVKAGARQRCLHPRIQ